MRRIIQFALISSIAATMAVGAVGAVGAADVQSFMPATLPQAEGSIESLIDLPDDLGSLDCKVICELHITTTGKNLWSNCYGADQPVAEPVRDAVRNAHRKARFNPARIGSVQTPVWMNTTTTINVTAVGTMIAVVPNDNADQRRKAGYSSPQVFGPVVNGNALRLQSNRRYKPFQSDPTFVTVTMHVSDGGRPWAYAIEEENKLPKWRREQLAYYLEQYRFIPAMEDGVPVASIYKEVIDSRRRR